MMYMFEAGNWIKVGVTRQSVWHRLVAFRATQHPAPEVCGTLRDLDSVRLRAVWPATPDREKQVHAELRSSFPNHVGEWYPVAAADRLRELMGEPEPLPERPSPEELEALPKKPRRPCCTGSTIRCFGCNRTFTAVKGLSKHGKICPARRPLGP